MGGAVPFSPLNCALFLSSSLISRDQSTSDVDIRYCATVADGKEKDDA
jgi:hypothetical protein